VNRHLLAEALRQTDGIQPDPADYWGSWAETLADAYDRLAARADVPADPDVLENDIRELHGAPPGELARRLIERGWTRAAVPAEGKRPDPDRR
jgi:hypothetical protein